MVDMEYGDFLYNLENDPGESTNLAKDQPEIMNELKSLHNLWKTNIQNKQ